ncbi:hypothetical protein [Oceanobacillus sp. CAU 1775]
MIDKETQIKVLLYGNPLGFACETLGVKNLLNHSYSEVFTVSKEEVYAYTLIHGIPESETTSKHSSAEGFHYYKEDGKWHTFFRERNYTFDELVFEDDEEGRKYIVYTLLKLTGTGLYS